MDLDLVSLKLHCNVTIDGDDLVLLRLLDAAKAKIGRDLGFAVDDETQFPDGTPADLVNAVLMTAADFYENREAQIIGVQAMALPIGVAEIVANYRNYTFDVDDDA